MSMEYRVEAASENMSHCGQDQEIRRVLRWLMGISANVAVKVAI
jgi:hypothetical protein